MTDSWLLIEQSVRESFPDIGSAPITAETRLEEIPGFDSMASVNLQMCLEEAFQARIPDEWLGGASSLSDILCRLEELRDGVHATA